MLFVKRKLHNLGCNKIEEATMRNLVKKFKEEKKMQRKTNVIALILALFIQTLLFVGITEFKNIGTTTKILTRGIL